MAAVIFLRRVLCVVLAAAATVHAYDLLKASGTLPPA